MKTCPKCGKANQPTRKFCIRCGASLLKPVKKVPKPEPAAESITTDSSEEVTSFGANPPPPTTNDEWVRPSQIQKDRIRRTAKKRGKSELDKARETFSRAEVVGISEEDGSIVETRMLRASEVHELLEGPSEMPAGTAGPAAAGGEAPAIDAPDTSEIEEQLLGAHSALISKDKESPSSVEVEEGHVLSDISEEFRSSRYDSMEATPSEEATPKPVVEAPTPATRAPTPTEDIVDRPTHCPKCGAIITIDNYDYPPDVYSAMAQARLKQARFFVVQSKYDKAVEIVRIARALFAKAGDPDGIAEVDKLARSIASKS